MAQTRISIIGAGIAGLTLGRSLAKHKIPYTIFERDSAETARKRHRYGITLEPQAYRPLLDLLSIDHQTFRGRLAVDAAAGGKGGQRSDTMSTPPATAKPFRANRQKLESLLSQDLNIKYEHALSSIRRDGKETTLVFTNGSEVPSDLVVAADGVHSSVRNLVDPETELRTLSYAVYRGKRLIKAAEEQEIYELLAGMVRREGTVLQQQHGQTLLQIQIDDLTPAAADLTYIFSRPAQDKDDPLFNPGRSKSSAKEIPSALLDEVSKLSSSLSGIFAEVFNADKMSRDRLLNWLMRSLPPPAEADLSRTAGEQGVVLLGDAVHAMPILGSYGANAAIEDALALGEHIASTGIDDIASFYTSRAGGWQQAVAAGEARLAEMHTDSKAAISSNL